VSGLLLDTHVFLWCANGPDRLAPSVRERIVNTPEPVYVSVITSVELAIKAAVGRALLPGDPEDAINEAGFLKLPLTFEHARSLSSLPMYHRDPFDRLLIAQAFVEDLTLVTHDRAFERYGIPALWT
jgi:PIN domain nuclease of toxin-antitoxin system